MCRLPGFVLVLCLIAQPSFADDRTKVVGLWKLVAYEVEVQATGERGPVMGQHPTGYVGFSPDGRVFFILTGEGRTPPKSDQDRANRNIFAQHWYSEYAAVTAGPRGTMTAELLRRKMSIGSIPSVPNS